MASGACSLNERRSQRNNIVLQRHARIACTCGWEVKFGYGVAVTLAIFEAKRFLVLILEIFAEWEVIRFAGGLRPVILTLVDVGVGLPTALVTVRAIRSREVPQCCAETKRALRCLLLLIAICTTMNTATLVSIGCHISVRREALIEIFNASMHLYINRASYKYAIDEIQFIFQCCGHSSYRDWFLFDWQRVDYASREEMGKLDELSDEEYRDRGVPFSCCSLRSMEPCVHAGILNADVKSINTNGCAEMISPILLRIVAVAYVMTSTLVVTQILLAFLLAKMIRKLLPGKCRPFHCPALSTGSNVSVNLASSETERRNSTASASPAVQPKKPTKETSKRRRKKINRVLAIRCIRVRNKDSFTDSSSSSSSPRYGSTRRTVLQAARIKPSMHEQHTISKKRLCDER